MKKINEWTDRSFKNQPKRWSKTMDKPLTEFEETQKNKMYKRLLAAAKTASGLASWRPRRPPDEPPGAQDGFRTRPWCQRRPPDTASDGPPSAKWAWDACVFLPVQLLSSCFLAVLLSSCIAPPLS